MKHFVKKTFLISALFSLFIFNPIFSENYIIDYYGIVSTEIDSNMSKMTSDLYYTQLSEITNFTLNDKRENSLMATSPDKSLLSPDNLSFYTVISKKQNSSKWISTITLINPKTNITESETKEYDSFYKILMEPQSVLHDSIINLLENKHETKSDNFAISENSTAPTIESTEFLSGTWTGEENIDKIVIMRGGRGFVIFTNGASMNITVELVSSDNEKQIVIKQNGHSNASFFPELSRSIALKEAINATPITWTFSVTNENTLSGIKNTLIEENQTAIRTNLSVIWKRKS